MSQAKITPFRVEPSATVNLSVAGRFFRVLYASGPINIRSHGGVFQTFRQGGGQIEPQAFTQLELANPIVSLPVFGLIQTSDVETVASASFSQDDSTILTLDAVTLTGTAVNGGFASYEYLPGAITGNAAIGQPGQAFTGLSLRRKWIELTPDPTTDVTLTSLTSMGSIQNLNGFAPALKTLKAGGAVITLETDFGLRLNNTAANVSAIVQVAQLWYPMY